MLMGTLKASIKNGVIEFFNNWQDFLEKQHLLKISTNSIVRTKTLDYNSLIYADRI